MLMPGRARLMLTDAVDAIDALGEDVNPHRLREYIHDAVQVDYWAQCATCKWFTRGKFLGQTQEIEGVEWGGCLLHSTYVEPQDRPESRVSMQHMEDSQLAVTLHFGCNQWEQGEQGRVHLIGME